MIPYGKQDISDQDIEAVVKVLKSDFLTQGPIIKAFEEAFAEYCGAKYAVAVSSCTAALHLAYMALNLNEKKRLWTTPNTFVATANAGLYCGAEIDFVDIDPQTYLMSISKLNEKLQQAKKGNKLPDIVAPVHFAGTSSNMKEIYKLSKEYGFKIVEDAAHCIGASYAGNKIGSCEFSDVACFSLHPVKIITSAEGGIITTNDKNIYKNLLMNRTHGITKEPDQLHKKDAQPWYFEQQNLGYHYRITDIQCALGLSQMSRLDGFVQRRRDLVKRYNDKLAHLPIVLPNQAADAQSSWHLYVIKIDKTKTKASRDKVFTKLRKNDIGVNMHYIPVYLHPYYENLGFSKGYCPNAEEYYDHAITIPLYPTLTNEEQDYVCKSIAEALTDEQA